MKVLWLRLALGILGLGLAGCGGVKPEPPKEEEQLDPYLPRMATRINQVIYSKLSTEEMLAELVVLGVAPGTLFADFKEQSGIDDWFIIETPSGEPRHVSLTCGLSPVVDGDDKITALYRSRKLISGKMYEEMELGPE